MGHHASKDIFYKASKKIDNLHVKSPWNQTLYDIVKELFSEKEAEVYVKMPYVFSKIDRISKISGYEISELKTVLESLADKGLVVDLWIEDHYFYMPSPMVIGIFEFTMMRTGDNLNSKEWAKLFNSYLSEDDEFFKANMGQGSKVSVARALPHEDSIIDDEHTKILDYESATAIVENSDKFAVGLCSCRHEKYHIGKKECDTPMDTCTSFGWSADYLIRHNMAVEVSKNELLENLDRSRDLGLVLCSDNVKNSPMFICQCCSCCCHLLTGISRHGYANTIVTSTYIAEVNESDCTGCNLCVKACPIDAIKLVELNDVKSNGKKKKIAFVDNNLCIGCGVCGLACNKNAILLNKRDEKVIHPETTFERIILQGLSNGNLQNQIFDNPESISQKFLRGVIGGFLKLPPSKKILMSDLFRSRFLSLSRDIIKAKGKGWITDL